MQNGFKLDDKEFLKRYAEAVTNYGDEILADGAGIFNIDIKDIATLIVCKLLCLKNEVPHYLPGVHQKTVK